MVTVFEARLPIFKTTGTADPVGAFNGSCTFTWYKPTNPGARPAKRTVPGTPPNSTLGAATVGESTVREAGEPDSGALDTCPNPTQKISIASVRFTGRAEEATWRVPA